MPTPGWYPDPLDRAPLRFFDGDRWTADVADQPPGRDTARSWWRRPVIVAAAVVLLTALLVVAMLVRPASPPVVPSPPPPAPSTSAAPAPPCPSGSTPVVNGRVYGGGLNVPVLEGGWDVRPVVTTTWADCGSAQLRDVAKDWRAELNLAGVRPVYVTGDLERQARSVIAESQRTAYPSGTTARDLSNRATTVHGRPAWLLRVRMTVHNRPGVLGDDVWIVVVEHPNGSRSVLFATALLGDKASNNQVGTAIKDLRIGNP